MPQTRDPILARAKEEINLIDFAFHELGFEADQKRTTQTPRSFRMRKDAAIIVIARSAGSNHWVYFNVHDPKDAGSIVDLCLNHIKNDFRVVKIRLQAWLGIGSTQPRQRTDRKQQKLELKASAPDLERVIANFERAEVATAVDYLRSRGLTEEVIAGDRFGGCVKVARGKYRNVLFGHTDQHGLCGFEIKNAGFTGFSRGGTKGLWRSRKTEEDEQLVVAESAIDAISYYCVRHCPLTVFASTGGGWGPGVGALLIRLANSLAAPRRVILAADRDEAGDKFTLKAEELLAGKGFAVTIDRPPKPGYDWNQVLMEELGLSR